MATPVVDLLAQPFPGGATGGLPPILSQLFGEVTGFSAQANVTVDGRRPSENMEMPMQFDYLNGRMRAEIDMSKIRGAAIPAQMMASLKQIGMDRVVTVMNGEDKPATILYPNLKASVEVKDASKPSGEKGKLAMEETKLGEDTVAGHACDKFRVKVGDQEALVWRARDLKAFPMQIRMEQSLVRMTVVYSDVKLVDPQADRFEVPKDYRKFDDMQAVMQDAMQRLLRPAAP